MAGVNIRHLLRGKLGTSKNADLADAGPKVVRRLGMERVMCSGARKFRPAHAQILCKRRRKRLPKSVTEERTMIS